MSFIQFSSIAISLVSFIFSCILGLGYNYLNKLYTIVLGSFKCQWKTVTCFTMHDMYWTTIIRMFYKLIIPSCHTCELFSMFKWKNFLEKMGDFRVYNRQRSILYLLLTYLNFWFFENIRYFREKYKQDSKKWESLT